MCVFFFLVVWIGFPCWPPQNILPINTVPRPVVSNHTIHKLGLGCPKKKPNPFGGSWHFFFSKLNSFKGSQTTPYPTVHIEVVRHRMIRSFSKFFDVRGVFFIFFILNSFKGTGSQTDYPTVH